MATIGKVCGHVWCALDNPIACCTCLDERSDRPQPRRTGTRRATATEVVATSGGDDPNTLDTRSGVQEDANHYPRYLDGKGLVYDAPRHHMYCTPCVDTYQNGGTGAINKVSHAQLNRDAVRLGIHWGEFGSSSSSASTPQIRRPSRLVQGRAAWLAQRRSALSARGRLGTDPQGWSASLFAMSNSAQQQGPAHSAMTAKTCLHDWCLLAQNRCCACLDRRPDKVDRPECSDKRFSRYIDGSGFLAIGFQEDGYCYGCVTRITSLRKERRSLDGSQSGSEGKPQEPSLESDSGPATSSRQERRREYQRNRMLEAFGGTLEQISANHDYVSPLTDLFEHMNVMVPKGRDGGEVVLDPADENPLSAISIDLAVSERTRDILKDLWAVVKAEVHAYEQKKTISTKYGLSMPATVQDSSSCNDIENMKQLLHDSVQDMSSDARLVDWLRGVLTEINEYMIGTVSQSTIDQETQGDHREECRVCLGKSVETVVLPCAHIMSCIECTIRICEPLAYERLDEADLAIKNDGMAETDCLCPVCREEIVCWTRFYHV